MTTQTTMTISSVASFIRGRLKFHGIKASVTSTKSSGGSVMVQAPVYGVEFSEDEQAIMDNIGATNGLLHAGGIPFDRSGYGVTCHGTTYRIN